MDSCCIHYNCDKNLFVQPVHLMRETFQFGNWMSPCSLQNSKERLVSTNVLMSFLDRNNYINSTYLKLTPPRSFSLAHWWIFVVTLKLILLVWLSGHFIKYPPTTKSIDTFKRVMWSYCFNIMILWCNLFLMLNINQQWTKGHWVVKKLIFFVDWNLKCIFVTCFFKYFHCVKGKIMGFEVYSPSISIYNPKFILNWFLISP